MVEQRAAIEMLAKHISASQRVIIITHTNPDGDAIGSSTAMYRYLKGSGKDVLVCTPNNHPDYLSFLDIDQSIASYSTKKSQIDEAIDKAQLIICQDFNNFKRIDDLATPVSKSGAKKVLIDHHPSPEYESFDIVISDTHKSSTCELVFNILNEIAILEGSQTINSFIAEPLYVGLMTDTNNFANSVGAGTFLMASKIMELGVDKEALQHKVFGGFSENRMRLMGHVLLNKMVTFPEHHAACIILTAQELEEFGFKEGDTEGFVNMPLNIKGIEISALFTEQKEHIRVSLRSVNDFSVNRFSRSYFNGGGHERAAGGRLYMSIEEVESYFTSKLQEFSTKA